jgi:pimeloyl-ACP methyl ester carboxylesterase
MGIDSILPVTVPVPDFPLTSATAHVYKAGNSSVWVVFKGSDVSNLLQNLECGHTPPVGGRFGARSADVRLHSGFYAGWQALEAPVTAAVLEFLQEVPTGKVYVVGHSLGAALASIAALRLSRTLPAPAEVAGVWLLAAPRAGNPTWKQIYNAVLLKKTLRISNFLDIAAGLPKPLEACGEAAEGGIILRVAPYNN